jgi:hypothetical protein
MAPVAIGLGIVLVLLGVGTYIYTDRVSVTALIPAFFGLAFALLGQLARDEKWRKHAMHAAATLGLLGFVAPAIMAVPRLLKLARGEEDPRPAAVYAQAAMALLCALFVGLCIRSFLAARRRPGGA